MKRITFDVSDELKKKLQILAIEHGKTITQLMIDAIKNTYNIKEEK